MKCVRALQCLTALTHLSLRDTKFDDVMLSCISHLASLIELDLTNTPITNAGEDSLVTEEAHLAVSTFAFQ